MTAAAIQTVVLVLRCTSTRGDGRSVAFPTDGRPGAPMGTRSAMRTENAEYGRCPGCRKIKHLVADGAVAAHNRYDHRGTSVTVVRCPGSGRPVFTDGVEQADAAGAA